MSSHLLAYYTAIYILHSIAELIKAVSSQLFHIRETTSTQGYEVIALTVRLEMHVDCHPFLIGPTSGPSALKYRLPPVPPVPTSIGSPPC